MVNALMRVPMRTAGWGALVFYALGLIVQVLVLVAVIPANWVNGGRAALGPQTPTSIANILVYALAAPFVAYVSGIVGHVQAKRWHRFVAWMLFALWTLGFVMQLLGTPFEKTVMTVILLVGVVSHLRIAVGLQRRHD